MMRPADAAAANCNSDTSSCPKLLVKPANGELLRWQQVLGRGGFATCHKFTSDATGQAVAVKVITKASLSTSFLADRLRQELEIHASLSHPNIVRMLWYQADTEHHYLVMDLCQYCSLSAMLRRRRVLTLPEAQHLCRRIGEACYYLHSQGVVHRDIKLANILLGANMVPKLTDFGLATRLSSPACRRRTRCGTVQYMAPEVLDQNAVGHGFSADVWSLGCVLVALLTGQPPVREKSMEAALRAIRQRPWIPPGNLCPVTKSLLRGLLCPDPALRPSIAVALRHPFFEITPQMHSLPTSCLSQQPRFDQLMPPPKARPPLKELQPKAGVANVIAAQETASSKPEAKKAVSNRKLLPGSKPSINRPPVANLSRKAPTPIEQATSSNDISLHAPIVHLTHEESPEIPRGGMSKVRDGMSKVDELGPRPPEAVAAASNQLSRYIVEPPTSAQACTAAAALLGAALAAPSASASAAEELAESPDLAAPLWVARWADCTAQGYGFGYELSDGSVGVRFSTSPGGLLRAAASGCLQFYDGDGREYLLPADCPALAGQLRLLNQFADYMRQNLRLAGPVGLGGAAAATRVPVLTSWRYCKDKAILLTLSNGLVQVNFPDHVKLLICSRSESVTLIASATNPGSGSPNQSTRRAFALNSSGGTPTGWSDARERLQRCLEFLQPMAAPSDGAG